MAYQDASVDDSNGITCLIVDGFAAVAKIGKLFDPEAASAMSGLARMIAPTSILKAGSRGLFRGKSEDRKDGKA
jgi:hypothetical protein